MDDVTGAIFSKGSAILLTLAGGSFLVAVGTLFLVLALHMMIRTDDPDDGIPVGQGVIIQRVGVRGLVPSGKFKVATRRELFSRCAKCLSVGVSLFGLGVIVLTYMLSLLIDLALPK